MLTVRGSMMLAIATIGLIGGLLGRNSEAALACLAILVWMSFYWLGILWLANHRPVLKLAERKINNDHESNLVLSINGRYAVKTSWTAPRDLTGMRFQIHEILPDTFAIVDGRAGCCKRSRVGEKTELNFVVQPAACGRFELPGLVVQINDWPGLFHLQRFIACPQQVTVLPWLIRLQTTTAVVKSNNIQSAPGQHAYRRAGFSAELLGIREYQPGDPPRTIAWKATARTGNVMSREFEMEVPVRTSVICGLSPFQFLERPATSVADRVITAAASLARLILSDRDPVALMLASEKGTSRISHGGGQRQLVRILHHLLDATARANSVENLSDTELYETIMQAAWRRFPQLFDHGLNSIPPIKLRLFPEGRRNAMTRRRLALVLAYLLNLPPGSEILLAADNDAMLEACRAWSRKYPVTLPRYHSAVGRPSVEEQHALQRNIVASLLQCRSRARDNELYIVIAELMSSNEANRELLEAIRVCRAAKHRVLLIETPARAVAEEAYYDNDAARILTAHADTRTGNNSLIRQQLTSLGVRCASLDEPGMMQKVVDEIDLLRSGKSRSANPRAFAH